MAYKRLTPQEWVDLERASLGGESNVDLAAKYGISESAIRKRLGSSKDMKVEKAAQKIVEMRQELELLPPALQIRAYSIADALVQISRNLTLSAELGAKTAHRLSSIANTQAASIDDDAPDPDKLKMIHGLTETANKAAFQPLELIKAAKGSVMDNTQEEVATIDPQKISSGAMHELLAARRSQLLS